MATEKIINAGSTTLNGDITSGATSIVVISGAVFPSSGDFHITCQNEIMLCTARSSNTLTVVRGQEGTTAVGHDSAREVKLDLTKASLDNLFLKDNILTGTYASRPAAGQAGRLYLPPAYTVSRDNGSSWDNYGPQIKLAGPMPTTGWSWVNQGSATATDRNGSIIIRAPVSAVSSLRIRTRTAPSRPFTLTVGFRVLTYPDGFSHIAIGWRDSASGKLVIYSFVPLDNINAWIEYMKWNSATSFNSSYSNSNWNAPGNLISRGLFFLRLETPMNPGQLRNGYWSPDNIHFRKGTANQILEDFFGIGIAPDEICIAVSNQNSKEAVGEFVSWEVT